MNNFTAADALVVIRNRIKEDKEFKNGWISNVAMSFYDAWMKRKRDEPEFGSGVSMADVRALANEAANNFLSLVFGQWHDHNKVDPGFFWVRMKGADRLETAYFDGKRYELTGTAEQYDAERFDRFIRIQPPAAVVKGFEGEKSEEDGPLVREPKDWTPAETIYAFVGDLTSYPVEVRAGANVVVYQLHDIAMDFMERHNLGGARDGSGWSNVIKPRKEGLVRHPVPEIVENPVLDRNSDLPQTDPTYNGIKHEAPPAYVAPGLEIGYEPAHKLDEDDATIREDEFDTKPRTLREPEWVNSKTRTLREITEDKEEGPKLQAYTNCQELADIVRDLADAARKYDGPLDHTEYHHREREVNAFFDRAKKLFPEPDPIRPRKIWIDHNPQA